MTSSHWGFQVIIDVRTISCVRAGEGPEEGLRRQVDCDHLCEWSRCRGRVLGICVSCFPGASRRLWVGLQQGAEGVECAERSMLSELSH